MSDPNTPVSGTFGGIITGTYSVAGGTIDTVAYTGATLGNGAPAVLQGPGTLDSSGYVSVNNGGGNVQLELTGGIDWTNTGTVYQGGIVEFGTIAGDSATIVNAAGAIYDLTTGNGQLEIGAAGTYSFVNAGLLEDNGGTNTLAVALDNTGTVSANNGNFYLSGPVNNTGTLQSDGGFLEVRGGTLGGTIQDLSGSVGLIGTYTAAANTTDTVMFSSANLGWFGDGDATLAGPGTVVSEGNVTVSNNGGGVQLVLTGGVTLENAGVFSQGGILQFGTASGDSATIVNQAGATYELASGNGQLEIGATGTYSFVNAGLLEDIGGGNDALAVPLDNTGTVSADNGNFYLSGPVDNAGTLQSDGGFLEVRGGTLGGTIQDLSGNVGLIGTYAAAANTTDTVIFSGANLGWFGDGDATLAGPGTVVADGNVTVSHNGGNVQLVLTGGVTLENAGAFTQAGALQFGAFASDSATIVNQSGDTYDLASGDSQLGTGTIGTYSFVNAGLLIDNGGGNDTVSVPLSNSGTVTSTNGNLYISNLASNTGTLQTGGGFIQVDGGVLGGLIEDNIYLVGTYTFAENTTVNVTFNGATFGNAGTATLAGAGTLASTGVVNVNHYGGNIQAVLSGGVTWANAETVNQNGALELGNFSGDSATILNQAGATWNLGSGDSQLYANGTGAYSFDNAGTLQMVGGGSNTIFIPLSNTGLLSANNGSLYLTSVAANSGTLQSNGGNLYIEGGALGGTIQIDPQFGGQVYVINTFTLAPGVSNVTFGNVYLGDGNAAILDGPGTLASNGAVTVYQYGGNVQLELTGGGAWDNTGVVNQNGAIQYNDATGNSDTIVNQSGATWELTSGNSQLSASGGGAYAFDNNGTLVDTGGGTDTVSVELNNTGLVADNNGNLVIAGGFSNSGTLQSNGGNLYLEGGTLGGLIQDNGGQLYLIGTYAIAGSQPISVVFSGATFGDGNTATLAGPGTLVTNGQVNVFQYGGDVQLYLSGGLTWDSNGTVNQYGAIELGAAPGDSATLVNKAGATWVLNSGNSQIDANGTGNYSYVNDGVFYDAGGGTNVINVPLTNAGTLTDANGAFVIAGGFSNSGTIQTAGGQIYLDNGVLGGSVLANNGAIYLQGTYTSAAGTTDTVTFASVTLGNATVATFAGPGTLASHGSATVNQYGGNTQVQLTGGITWENYGDLTQSGVIQFGTSAGDAATLVNEAGGVIDLASGNAQIITGGSGTYTLVNAGLLDDNGGGSDSVNVAIDETSTGTIANTNGALNFNAGGYIDGEVTGSNQINFSGNVTLAAAGDITASNINFSAGTLFMQGGTINSSNLTIGSNEFVVGYGALGDISIGAFVDASGGLLTVNGPIAGSPTYQIESGATLELNGSTSHNVTFNGVDATLKLDSIGSFSGTVEDFGGGDTIDLAGGVTLSAVSYVGGDLIGTVAAGGTISIAAPGVNSGLQLKLGADASGNSTIYLAPSPVSASPEILTTLGANNTLVLPDVHVATVGGSSGTFSDSLEDGINPTFWTATLENPPFYTDSTGPGGVTFQKAGNSTPALSYQDAHLSLNLAALGGDISGNFSVSVSYDDASIFGGSGLDQVELHTTYSDSNVFYDSQTQQGDSGVFYVWTGVRQGTVANSNPTSGTFTISRVNGVVSGYIDGNLIYSETETAALTAVAITLQNNNGSDDSTAVTFNNFSVSAASIPASSGTPDETNLAIANTATSPADGLNVSIGASTGDAFGSGAIASLAPGATDNTSIAVGLNDATAGAQTGSVALNLGSDGSVSGITGSLGTDTINLTGSVYRYASPSIAAPANVILHVGDGGGTASEELTVANVASADGFSEGLDAAATGAVTGNLLSATGATPDIAAGGSDSSAISVNFSTGTAGTISGDVAVAETSDGAGVDTLGVTALGTAEVPVSVTINNYATIAVEQVSGPGTLSSIGSTYTLDLGSVAIGPGQVSDSLDIANIASGPADWTVGTVTASGAGAFNDIGLGSGTILAGAALPVTIDLSSANSGVFSQTLTLVGTDANASGYSEALPGETVVVVGTVLPNAELAQPSINEPSPLLLPDVHVVSLVPNDQTTLSISNVGSAQLSGAVIGASGNAYGSGSFGNLVSGGTDSADIVAGLNNTSAGAKSGSLTLEFGSGGTGGVSLPSETVSLEGNVYRYASPSISGPSNVYVHVGDGSGSESAALTIVNAATADGFSENLDATAVGASGGATSASGTASEIAAGTTNNSSVNFEFSTTQAATVTGAVNVAEVSDGSGVDTLGTTMLGTADVPVSVTVNNYATAAIEQTGGAGALMQSGSVYTLNLGTFAQGAGAGSAELDIANTASGPADALSGSLSVSGDSAFSAYGGGASAFSVDYFEVASTGNGPDFGSGGTPNIANGSTLGPDGLPVASSPAGIADVDPSTQEITWWDPTLNSGVVATGSGIITLPYGSNMYAPDSTGSNDGTWYETAILQGVFSLAATQSVQFELGSDDDSFIYIDGTLIGQNPGIHGAGNGTVTASNLGAGTHSVEVFYDDRQQSGAYLSLNVLTPGVTIVPANASGLGAFGNIGAGQSTPFSVDLSTANAGVFNETITLAATGSNPSGYSGTLPGETLEVTGTVLGAASLANAVINSGSTIALSDAHTAASGTTDFTTLGISNTGSAVLSAVVSGTTGNAYGSGAIDQLAPGGTSTSDITVGLGDNSAGAKSGSVTLALSSGGDNLLTDGSFEDSADFGSPGNDTVILPVGSTVMQGWTVAGSEPLGWIGPSNPYGLSAEDGSYFLDLTGNSDGPPYSGVSQTIATTSGDQYLLSFELGSSSSYGLPDGVTATAGGTSQTFTTTLTGSNNWQLETLDFTASASTTTISLVGASGNAYIGLDDVSVTSISAPTPIALNPQTVSLSGNVYNYAAASITAPSVTLHVGDDGGLYTENLTAQNTAPAGVYSEGLEVTAVGGAGGAVTGAGGTTGDIAAGNTDTASLSVTFSTASAANGGTVAVAETSDGTGIDTLGTTLLGTVDVPLAIAIDNYATAAIVFVGGNGTLAPAGIANTYTLNLGSTEQFSSPLSANLSAQNAAAGPAADLLDGNYSISGDSVFADTGFGNFSNVSFGNNAGGNDVVLNTGTIGTFTQQITLNATGTNASGYSGALGAETIDVVGTIVPIPPPPPPPLPVATVWGDVHITTFDGLYYNFQAEGEFILAQSTTPDDSFEVQGRMQPWSEGATVSVLTMLAAELGTDRVTFGLGRTDVVWVNGTPQNLVNGQTVTLSGGTVTQTSSSTFQVTWNTGEVMQVTDAGSYFNMDLTLARADMNGGVQGLLGSDTGQANDFQLADGTVLAQPLSSAQLYGEFASAWHVTQDNSLLDYLSGQTTATFTDSNFPSDAISVTNLPAAIVQQAQLEVQQAGITDPNLAAAAVVDLLVTGDPNALLNDLNVNQTGETTQAAVINSPPPPVPALGVSAAATNVVESASGTTTVAFTAYLTSASGTDTVIDWAVTAPDATFLNAAALGGTLPSGSVTVPAGQTTAQFSVTLPANVLGSMPSSNLQVSISSTNGDPIFGHTAQTEIDNSSPVAGNPAVPLLTLLSGPGVFAGSGNNFTLNVGTLVAGEGAVQDRFQFANAALAPSDSLAGSIAASGSGFTVYGAQPLTALSSGSNYQGLVVQANSGATGPQSETIVIHPVDENITGYSSILAAETLTISDTVLPAAVGEVLTGGPINLGTFYQGQAAATALSIANAAASGSAALDVSASASGNATSEGSISSLAAGGTIDNAVFAGLDTSSPGVKTGTVTLNFTSDAGSGNTASDGSAQISVTGTVYGPAVASFSAPAVYVHQGDDGGSVVVPITISNSAATDGYTENLEAEVVHFGTYVTGASGSVIDLAPGASNASAITATLGDSSLGTYSGEVEIALQSDGTGIDNEGTTSLGNTYVTATVNVDQYAVAAMEQTGGNGTLTPTGVATQYTLDLGTVAQYSTPLGASLAVLNDVLGTADLLGGSFTISGAPEFENVGFSPFGSGTESAGLAAQQTDSAPFLVLSSGTVGVFSETITLDPSGYNPSGYSHSLTPVTISVTGTVVAAPPPTPAARVADAWGDVHLTTFDGLYYNFQAEGEFVLSESTISGDTFAVQARMQPWNGSSSVSVNTMIAAQVGSDRVSFAIDRSSVVWIDGAAVSLSGTPVVTLAGGSLEQTSADSYRLVWNTGEELDVTDDGSYLNATISLPNSDAGNVQGLLGNDDGNANNDLMLPGGTLVTTDGSVSYAELYGQYANAWRISDATSLMDYTTGQDTGSFTDVNFPYNQIGLGNLPANAVQQALAAAEAAGITDPNLQEAAIIDYLFTGNPDALQASANVQQQEGTIVTSGQTLTAQPTPSAVVGVQANVASVVESTTGPEAVGFTVYLTSPEASAAVIDYTVHVPGPGFLNSSDFAGDILPNGTVTIAAGQTSAVFTVALPADVLGSAADANLQVEISPENPNQGVFAPLAQTEVINAAPTAGNIALPEIEGVSGNGDLSTSGSNYVLNLGTVEQYGTPLEAGWGVLNAATAPADLLSGSFVVNGSTQFLNSGLAPFTPIAAGDADTAPVVEMLTNQVGTFTETVKLSPADSNDSGYSAALNAVTLTVTGTVLAPPTPPPPPVPEATAWGDVHITTFDGLYYNFQATGEYVLTKSTVAGDTFQVQARLEPYGASTSVSVQTQIGAAIGADDVVFAVDESSPFYLNGTADALGIGQTVTLSAGSVTDLTGSSYRVNWNTGESMTVSLAGSYINDTIALTAADAGNVQGLLGPDNGNPSTDLQLANGTPLIATGGTIAASELYGSYASAWTVSSAGTSLMYYGASQSFGGFNIPGFPNNALTLSQLPANLVAAAEAQVEAEGITNPNLIDAAVVDLLVTGDANSVFASENVQEQGVNLNGAAISVPVPLPSVGIFADSATEQAPASGTLAVDYTVYLTAAEASTATIDYNVTTPGPTFLGSSNIVGGTGSGVVQIAAGQTSAQITVDVLANALGSQPNAYLQVSITPEDGESVFGGSAQTEIVNPTPTAGNPAQVLVEQLGGDGYLSGSGTNYILNLGTQVKNGEALFANIGVENGATLPADDLSGEFSISNFTNYLNTGFTPFSSIAPQAADTEPVVTLNTGTIGVFTEQVVLDPTDTNPTGYSSPMNDVTLTVTGTIVPAPLPPPPSVPTATAWGDVHITTFDGLLYNFQAVGEFTLAQSTLAGDNFNVQIRTKQWSPGATVSVIDQVATGIDSTDSVTFGLLGSDRSSVVELNGAAYSFSGSDVLTLSGGTVTEESSDTYVVRWDTGESLTVSVGSSYINTSVALSPTDGANSVQGLLGYNAGVATDFEPVVSGTTITTSQLYGAFAQQWSVTQATSLLNYVNGETHGNETDLAFPSDALSFSDLPGNLQNEGLQAAIQAGITDPQEQQAAALDYIVTGDPEIITGSENVQQQGITTTSSSVTAGAPAPALGVSANNAALVESSSGNLAVGFTVYLTQAEANATTVDYAVTAPDASYLGASDFTGDMLPSGTVTIAAGQTSANFSVAVPANVLGTLPSENLQVTITPTGGESVFAPSAQTTIVNTQVEPGTGSSPAFALLSGEGTLTEIGNAYTLTLGNFTQGETVESLGIAVENNAAAGSDDLAGTLTATSTPGFTVSGTGPLPDIAPGTGYQGLHVAVNTAELGAFSETISLAAVDQNASGYSSDPPDLTLTITGNVGVECFASGTRIRTARGEVKVEELREGDLAITAIDGSEARIVWVGHREVDCKRHPNPETVWPVRISAGAFGRGMPKRMLTLSPDHAVYVNEVLVPVKHLLNGTTIRQVKVDRVTYYHVELERHDVLLADGMPAESYLDVGDRANFANGGAVVRLHIDLAHHWEAGGCAPLVIYGAELDQVKQLVAAQESRAAGSRRARTAARG